MTDPIEQIIADALTKANVTYNHKLLDFYLPDYGVCIECKQFFTPRINRQMQSQTDIILIQGRKAARLFANLIGVRP